MSAVRDDWAKVNGKPNGRVESDTAALAAEVRRRMGFGPASPQEVIDA